MNNSDRKRTWEDLGIPRPVVEEHENMNYDVLRDPSPELVERTIEACLAEGKRRQEREHNQKMESNPWYRLYLTGVEYVQSWFK